MSTPIAKTIAKAVATAPVAPATPVLDRSRPAIAIPAQDQDDASSATPSRRTFSERLGVLAWSDAWVRPGITLHDSRSAYVETFWLPVIGPSATLLLRRLADEFDSEPDGFEINCVDLSREIGLGARLHSRSPFVRTVDRLTKFHLADLRGDVLFVCRQLPDVSPRQIARLSERLQALHRSWTIDAADDDATHRVQLVRATHLARTLHVLGETPEAIERQLHRWQFHPSIAWHAVQWAQADEADDIGGYH